MDNNIPIKIFEEPYFTQRLNLLDEYYDCLSKWDLFNSELKKYPTENDFFNHYNKVKDDAIAFIKQKQEYKNFIETNFSLIEVKNKNLPTKSIYKTENIGKRFLSIDMKKANFSSLRYYDYHIFGGASTWEKFISNFTDNQHIINSKHIRQVILGNCCAKKQIQFETLLMDELTHSLIKYTPKLGELIVFFSNDEVVFDISEWSFVDDLIKEAVKDYTSTMAIPFRVKVFTLQQIGKEGYLREFDDSSVDFKCVDANYVPFVIRRLRGEEVTEDDKVFVHNDVLCKYIESPI